jgi:membrane protein implicated in regulation of membrane protease activity
MLDSISFFSVLWLIAAVILAIIEAATLGLVTLWFAIGAIFALAADLMGLSIQLQVIIFILSSGILVYFTRPLAKKYLKTRTVRTNADRLIGTTGIVIEKIQNVQGTGQVKISGQEWTARSFNDEDIPEGEKVEIIEISGVKLLVKREKRGI